jgi:hypothetical protein
VSQSKSSAEIQGVTVFALGSFNPPIFQPFWFSKNNLIREEEARDAVVTIITNEVTQFTADWLSVLVTKERFTVETKDPTMHLPLRDVAAGTFGVLEHTPIRGFAFSRFQHFRLPSEDDWHNFGDYFAPKQGWTGIFPKSGLRTLVMQDHRGADKPFNYKTVRLEPSALVQFGVFVQMTEHHDPLAATENPDNRLNEFIDALQSSWDRFLADVDDCSKHLLTVYKTAPSK